MGCGFRTRGLNRKRGRLALQAPQSASGPRSNSKGRPHAAQLGTADMRVPIAYGLSWPERVASGAQALDFRALPTMSFEAPDARRFPGLQLAWEVLAGPTGGTAVLNAANEVAVQAFLDGRIRFDQIHQVNRATLDAWSAPQVDELAGLLAIDGQARERALALVRKMGPG